MTNYLPGAAAMQKLAGDSGRHRHLLPVRAAASNTCPAKVPNPPKTRRGAARLRQGQPRTVQYARPANSGPGRTFLMGLPYLLGDKDPKDPVNGWDKTWAYLTELNKYVELYPSGTGETMKNLAERHGEDHRHHDRLGHQPARPRPGAEEVEDRRAQGLHLGHRRPLRRRAQGRVRRQAGRDPAAAAVHADPGAAGQGLRQGLLLPGPGGQGRAAVDGARRTARTRSRSSAAPSTTR